MKCLASYLFTPLLLCAYLAATIGFEVHSCTVEGSCKMRLMTGQSPCQHECNCFTHDDQCCQTSVYVMDDEQNIADYTKIVVPTVVLDIVWHNTFSNSETLYDTAAFVMCTATIAFGPCRGLSALVPLRC